MTVKELIDMLSKFEPDLDVVYPYDGPDAFQYLDINSVLYNQDSNEVVISE